MAHASTGRLREELGRVEEELGSARLLEHRTEERPGRLRVGPHPLLPERGWLVHDRSAGTVAWVREVPSPAGASEILAEHGVAWGAELLSHSLEPVPEEAERGR